MQTATAFHPVITPAEIAQTAQLADEIWHECFSGMIGAEQIDYMVERFQSAVAMQAQIAAGYVYYTVTVGGETAGYFAYQPTEGTLFLSKLYIRRDYRGCGLAGEAFRFLKDIAARERLTKLWLTVNRGNVGAIAAYKRFGMHIEREQVKDIGGGFVMDDYIFAFDMA
ncbi:MAG: GNAT family N-acetyltransferase [Oscillospiraceae bacterium]